MFNSNRRNKLTLLAA